MPVTQKQKPGRGIPRKAANAVRKLKFQRYLAKASCVICKLVFRSPKYKLHHTRSLHKDLTGVNKRRSGILGK